MWKFFEKIKKFMEPIAKVIQSIVNFILLFIVYLIGIGPVSLIMRSFGKKFLDIKKQNHKSNWVDHKVEKEPIEKYFRTF